MKDAIDKRNERERIAKSIVKGWNVKYITREELERRQREEEEEAKREQQLQEERAKADEILKRLEREAKEDEEKKNREIRELMQQQAVSGHHEYGTYGTAPMDDITQEKVEAILSDKERRLQMLIQDTDSGKLAEDDPKVEGSISEESGAAYAGTETDDSKEAEAEGAEEPKEPDSLKETVQDLDV